MARVKFTCPERGLSCVTRGPPKPEQAPDNGVADFTEEDAARMGAVLYDLYVILTCTVGLISVQPVV